jgi:hypothetical protein
MAVIRDPDYLYYGEYDVAETPTINPYTKSKAVTGIQPGGQPAQLLLDYDDKKFILTAPQYGQIGAGNTEMVGYGGTGGVTGQALYSKFKQIWKTDDIAVKFPFPMEAITPESFEFINGWEPDDDTNLNWFPNAGIATGPAITRKLLRDCGWAERTTIADGNVTKRRYFGIITLGAISKPTNDTGDTVNATVYCSQLDPGITTSFDVADIASNRAVFNTATMPDLWTGNRVVYQEPTGTPLGIGLTHNNFYYIRHRSNGFPTGARPVNAGIDTTQYRLEFYQTREQALDVANTTGLLPLTAATGEATIRNVSEAPNFVFDITEEGGNANEPFKFYDTSPAPNYTILYNYDNYFKIFNREKGKTYAEQTIAQVGVTQINYQAYRIPLATAADANLGSVTDNTIGNTPGTTYDGIEVKFYQEPVTRSVGGTNYDFNVVINAAQNTLTAVYQYVQWLLRMPDRINTDVGPNPAYDSINALSAVGGPGAGTSYGNDLRYGKTEEPLLEFIGNVLFARTREDVYNESNGSNYGIYIENVASDDLNNIRYYDNTGALVAEPFVSSYTLVFNTNLNADNDARFWVFYNTDENITGLSTDFDITATGVVGVSDGIDAANNQIVFGNTRSFHGFVNGQEVVAISTVSNPGIGITCETFPVGVVTYTLDNQGVSAYEYTLVEPADYAGKTYTLNSPNPTIYVYEGDSAEFIVDAHVPAHPFVIKQGSLANFEVGFDGALGTFDSGNNWYTGDGVVGNGRTTAGITTFTPPADSVGVEYYYICAQHASMRGSIVILDKTQDSAFKYYVNALQGTGIGQTFGNITESGIHTVGGTPDVIGVGLTSTFRLHRTYLEAVANNGVGINTISLNVSTTNTGLVTFTQTDINYQENKATIVQTSEKQFSFTDGVNVGLAQTYATPEVFLDGIDVPSSGSYNVTFDYDFNSQRNRIAKTDASVKVVAIGLEQGQFVTQDFTISDEKNVSIQVAGALERVYNDPTT